VLEEGDIVSIDCGAIVEGWHADAAVTVGVGDIDDETRRLVDTARRALDAQIAEIVEGARLGDVGAACEEVVEAAGFSVTGGYTGHGIGTAMHEPPEVRNEGPRGRGLRLRVGHVLALEPMVNAGTPDTRVLSDGWTVVTADGRKASHFEHTVAVTESGAEILTIP
jgi:methionyl aminopeptidase